MTLAAEIAPHLPFLRRYARALTGSQASGDAYVAAVLEALIADRSAIARSGSTKLALFKAFNELWQSIKINFQPEVPANKWEMRAQRNLGSLTPRSRQAFLLVAVEGFTPHETAEILGADNQEVSELLTEAGQEIADQMATDVLIIEDEPLIAMDLETLATELGHSVIGVARTHREAIEKVRQHRPGLVLADIQLADGSSGIDAVNEILASMDVPVVFVTAFPERLLTGKRPEPAFLVTKPFQPDMVKAVVSQALFFDTAATTETR